MREAEEQSEREDFEAAAAGPLEQHVRKSFHPHV